MIQVQVIKSVTLNREEVEKVAQKLEAVASHNEFAYLFDKRGNGIGLSGKDIYFISYGVPIRKSGNLVDLLYQWFQENHKNKPFVMYANEKSFLEDAEELL